MIKQKVAFYGAFNPPTWAHVKIAQAVQQQLPGTEIIFVPSRNSYIMNKQHKSFSFSAEDRVVMLLRLCDMMGRIRVSTVDLSAKRQPRTYQSLRKLKSSGADCSLLIGADQLLTFETGWRNPDKILRNFGLICASRADADAHEIVEKSSLLKKYADNIMIIDVPDEIRDISSTKVRELLTQKDIDKEALKELMPPILIDYAIDSLNRAVKGEKDGITLHH